MASRPAAPSLVKLKHRCRRALFCRQHREVIVAASCILKVDRDIRTNDVSAFAQAISERRQRDLDTRTLFKGRRPDREPADTGIVGCCARAARGDTAAAPPSSTMNSRRLIGSPP